MRDKRQQRWCCLTSLRAASFFSCCRLDSPKSAMLHRRSRPCRHHNTQFNFCVVSATAYCPTPSCWSKVDTRYLLRWLNDKLFQNETEPVRARCHWIDGCASTQASDDVQSLASHDGLRLPAPVLNDRMNYLALWRRSEVIECRYRKSTSPASSHCGS